MPEQARASWGRLRQVGASRGKLGQVGASLKLHNAAIVFCRLCVLFTIYVSGTNCVNHSDEMNKKGRVDWSKIDGSSPKPKWLQNWKKTKQTAGITVQYRCVIMMDLKVNAAAGNM